MSILTILLIGVLIWFGIKIFDLLVSLIAKVIPFLVIAFFALGIYTLFF